MEEILKKIDVITTSMMEHVCDNLCRFPREIEDQDKLECICADCKIDKKFNLCVMYEDTGFTPEQIKNQTNNLSVSYKVIEGLQKESREIYNQLLDTEKELLQIRRERDFWRNESMKWCDQSFEYRLQLERGK